jgi:hypothetical protein
MPLILVMNILYKILNARMATQVIQILYENEGKDTLSLHFTSEDKKTFEIKINGTKK